MGAYIFFKAQQRTLVLISLLVLIFLYFLMRRYQQFLPLSLVKEAAMQKMNFTK